MHFLRSIQKRAEKKFDPAKTEARHQYTMLKVQELGFTSPNEMIKVLGFKEFRRVLKDAPSVI